MQDYNFLRYFDNISFQMQVRNNAKVIWEGTL